MNITKEQVLKALSTVDDPDLKKDLVTLNMIRKVETFENTVKFTVMLTTPACPLKEKIKADCINAIHTHIGENVEVMVTMSSEVTTQGKSQELKNVKNIIAVVSGKGGVGKSTVAANLAVGLALTGAKVSLVDADIYGPSMPIMFGLQDARPRVVRVGDKELIEPFKQHGIKVNSIGFLVPAEQAIVWRGPMASKAMQQIIFDTHWEETDYMVIDMPPGTGDLHLTLVQRLPVTGVVVVTTPQQVALADTRKGAAMFTTPQINVPILGIVENMAYFVPHDLPDRKYFIFGEGGGAELAAQLDVPLLGQIPLVEQVRQQGDDGVPVVLEPGNVVGEAFKVLSKRVAQEIAIRNSQLPPTENVKIMYS